MRFPLNCWIFSNYESGEVRLIVDSKVGLYVFLKPLLHCRSICRKRCV